MTIRRAVPVALLLVLASSSFAATFTVTDSGDAGPGTLRQAILDANANPGRDAIVFQTSAGPLTSLPTMTDAVDIDGTVGGSIALVFGAPAVTGLRFGVGSSTSTLRDIRVDDFSNAVRIDFGVNGVVVANSRVEGTLSVSGNDNFIGEANIISFFDASGNSNEVIGNQITDVNVTGASNLLERNTTGFVRILGGDNNRIGTNGSGNTTGPISLESATGSIVEGNAVSSSTSYGILVRDGSSPANTRIDGNTINGGTAGVRVTTVLTVTTGVEIAGNSIRNVDIPIDLGSDGSTANDPAPDADTGPNNLQNFPVLTSATLQPSALEVQGSLTSAPLTTYRVEIFSSSAADPEAQTFLGSFDVTTDAAGSSTFTGTVSTLPSADEVITSTATNTTTLDTSEVSAPVVVDAPGELGFSSPTFSVNEADGTITLTVNRTGGSEGTVMVDYATGDGTATAPADYAAASGTLTFDPGVTTQTIVISIVADGLQEPAETFTVTLSGPTGGATLGTATATVTISADAASIPTASTWGLIALALTLALIALRR